MSNVPALLKSKRFWVSVLGLLTIIVSAFEPTLATKFNEIVPAVLIIVGFLVGGYSLEDAVTAYNPPADTSTPAAPPAANG
jgi:hypothetical protein